MVSVGLMLDYSSNFILALIGTSKFRYGSKRVGASWKPDITTGTEWTRELRSQSIVPIRVAADGVGTVIRAQGLRS